MLTPSLRALIRRQVVPSVEPRTAARGRRLGVLSHPITLPCLVAPFLAAALLTRSPALAAGSLAALAASSLSGSP